MAWLSIEYKYEWTDRENQNQLDTSLLNMVLKYYDRNKNYSSKFKHWSLYTRMNFNIYTYLRVYFWTKKFTSIKGYKIKYFIQNYHRSDCTPYILLYATISNNLSNILQLTLSIYLYIYIVILYGSIDVFIFIYFNQLY